MCEPVSMMTAGAAILSTAIGVTQQMQHASTQRGDYNYLAAQQRNTAAVDESRAQQDEQALLPMRILKRRPAMFADGNRQHLGKPGRLVLGFPLHEVGENLVHDLGAGGIHLDVEDPVILLARAIDAFFALW